MKHYISRADAQAQGLKRYFSGRPCRRAGHIAERYVSTKGCCECWRTRDRPENYARQQRERMRRRLGIPVPEYPEPSHCEANCGTPGPLVPDHDHTTGRPRGWLCGKCNVGLGMIGDSLDAAERIVAYLRKS